MSATGVQSPPSPTNLKTIPSNENNLQPSSAPGENHHVKTIEMDASNVNVADNLKGIQSSSTTTAVTKLISDSEKKAPDKENKVNGESNGGENARDAVDFDGKGEEPSTEFTAQDNVNNKDNVVLVSVDLNVNGTSSSNLIEKNDEGDECNGQEDKIQNDAGEEDIEKSRSNDNDAVVGGEDDNAVDMDIHNNQQQDKEEVKEDDTPKATVENDPNFAVICSFLDKFAPQLDIQYSILHLKTMFEEFTKVRQDLIDLHIKLLRKRKKYINKDRWESALVKFCSEYSKADSWELERFGYKNASLTLRLRIFLRLLEAQFDFNQKFKSEVNSNNQADSLRLESFGRDITGFSYWYQSDADLNFRLYKQEPDEDGSWSLVCKNLPELHELIGDLESKSTLDLKVESTSNSDDDNSNIASLLQANKEVKVEEEEEEEDEGEGEEDHDEENLDDEEKVTPPESSERASPIEVKREEDAEDETIINVKVEPTEECVQSIQDDSNDTQVKGVCESLINQVEEGGEEDGKDEDDEDNDDEEDHDANQQSKNNSRNKRKRKRKRGGYSWGKKRPRNATTKKTKEAENVPSKDTETEQQQQPDVEEKKEEKKRGRKRRTELDKLAEDISVDLIEKRTSRRIQVLQEKRQKEIEEEAKRREKEAEQKKRQQEAAKAAKKAAYLAAINEKIHQAELEKKSRKQRKQKGKVEESEEEAPESEEEEEEDSRTAGKKRKKRRRGKGKRKRGNNPWEDSDEDDEEPAHIEEDYEEYEMEDEALNFDDKDDEDWFACEEIDPEDEPIVVRRARTAKKSKDEYDPNEEVVNDDKPCGRCGKYDNPHWILLCDSCDIGFHTACLRPPLFIIPTGDWFCPPCEHKKLTEKIIQVYDSLTEALELKAREAIKKKKRWQFGTQCDIAVANILSEEEDGETAEADQDDNDEVDDDRGQKKSSNRGRAAKAKRKRRTIKDEIDELLDGYDDEFSDSDEEEEEEVSRDRRRNGRRLESESETDEDDSEEEEDASSSDDSRDDIDIALERDRNPHPRVKKTKKTVNVEDYSRSGLKLRAARRRKPISYVFKEFDEMINSAIIDEDYQGQEGYEDEAPHDEEDEEDEERDAAGLPRSIGKDMSNILRAEMPDFSINPFDPTSSSNKDASTVPNKTNECSVHDGQREDAAYNEESKVTKKKRNDSVEARGKKKRSLTQLDISTDEEVDNASDEDFRMADDDDDEDEDELTEVEDDNDNTEEGSDDDYCISTSRRRSSRVIKRPARFGSRKKSRGGKKDRGKKSKSSRRRDAYDEDEDEDETEMSEEEGETEMSDQSSDYEPRGKRRAAKKFSYIEDSSSSETPVHFGSRKSNKKKKGKYEEDEAYSDEEEEQAEAPKKKNQRKRAFIDDDDDDDDEEEDEFDKSVVQAIDKRSKGGDLKTYSKTTDKSSDKAEESEKVVEEVAETKDVPTTTTTTSTTVVSAPPTKPEPVLTTTATTSLVPQPKATITTASAIDPISSMKQMVDRPPVPPVTSVPATTSYVQPPPPQQHTSVEQNKPVTPAAQVPPVVNTSPAPYHYHHPGVPPQAPPPPHQPYHYPPQPYPPGSPYGNVPPHHPPPYGAPPGPGYVYGAPPGPGGLPPSPSGQWGAPPPPSPHYAYPAAPPGVAYAYPRGPPLPPPPPPQHMAAVPTQYQRPPQPPHPALPTQSPIKSDGYSLANLDTPPSPYRVPPAAPVATATQPPSTSTPQLLNLDSGKTTTTPVHAYSQAPPRPHYGPPPPPSPQQAYYAPGPPPPYDAVRYQGPPPPPHPHSSPSNAFHSPYSSIPPHHSGYSPQRQPIPGTPPSPYAPYPPQPAGQYVSPNGGFMIQNLLVQQQQQQQQQQPQQIPKATKSGPVATKSGPIVSQPMAPSSAGPSPPAPAAKSKKAKGSSNGEPKKSKPTKGAAEKTSAEGTSTG